MMAIDKEWLQKVLIEAGIVTFFVTVSASVAVAFLIWLMEKCLPPVAR
jgi:hypothetical protein